MNLIDKIFNEGYIKNPNNVFKNMLFGKIPDGDFNIKYGNDVLKLNLKYLDSWDDEFFDNIYMTNGNLQNVDLRNLSYYQDEISDKGSFSNDNPIFVLQLNNKMILTDGYHRVYDLLKQNKFTTIAYVMSSNVIKNFSYDTN